MNNITALVRDAEAALVVGNYKRARLLATKAIEISSLQNGAVNMCNGSDGILLMTITISFPEIVDRKAFVFRIGHRRILVGDRAVVVLLQSSYELSKWWKQNQSNPVVILPATSNLDSIKNDLLIFLNQYAVDNNDRRQPPPTASTSVMPLEVAVVFIGFCHAVGYTNATVDLIVDILSNLTTRQPLNKNNNEISAAAAISKTLEDLLLLLLTKILPFATNSTHVSHILHSVFHTCASSNKTPCHLVLSSQPNEASVAQIMTCLETLSSDGMHPSAWRVIVQCQTFLQPWMPKSNANALLDPNNGRISAPRDHRFKLDMTTCRQRLAQFYRALVSVLREYIADVYVKSDDRWANRGRAALTVFLLVIAWRKQQTIRRNLVTLITASLGPVREVLDASLPSATLKYK